MSPAEIVAHLRIFTSLDVEAALRSVNEGRLAQADSKHVRKFFSDMGVRASAQGDE